MYNIIPSFMHTLQADSEKASNLPKDGTVHELTSSVSSHSLTHFKQAKSTLEQIPSHIVYCLSHSQTMWFIEQLLDYSRILGEVLQGQSSYATSSTDLERNKALGKFLSK